MKCLNLNEKSKLNRRNLDEEGTINKAAVVVNLARGLWLIFTCGLLVVLALVLALAMVVHAANIEVTNNDDSRAGSLLDAAGFEG